MYKSVCINSVVFIYVTFRTVPKYYVNKGAWSERRVSESIKQGAIAVFSDLLFILGIRFFLFDFILFKNIREYLKIYYVFKKLFDCTFCQGFWCGLAYSVAMSSLPVWQDIIFAFISAIVCFTWTMALYPYIRRFEKEHDLPMT